MIGIGKVWKSVTGREAAVPAASTIPRDLANLRGATPLVPVLNEAGPAETRAADRFVPLRTGTVLATAAGRKLSARIINVSRTGVAVEADFSEIHPHEIATVGTRPVVPGRRIALGAVFQFRKPLDPKLCGPEIIL